MSNTQFKNNVEMANNGKNGHIKQLKEKAYSRIEQEKQELAKKLKDVKTVYVSYLNQSRTEMDFYFISKDYNNESVLERIWITKPYYIDEMDKDQYGISKYQDLPFKDKPSGWEKARSRDTYCFKAGGYGYSKSDHLLKSLYMWFGVTSDEIYKEHKFPRIEELN